MLGNAAKDVRYEDFIINVNFPLLNALKPKYVYLDGLAEINVLSKN